MNMSTININWKILFENDESSLDLLVFVADYGDVTVNLKYDKKYVEDKENTKNNIGILWTVIF